MRFALPITAVLAMTVLAAPTPDKPEVEAAAANSGAENLPALILVDPSLDRGGDAEVTSIETIGGPAEASAADDGGVSIQTSGLRGLRRQQRRVRRFVRRFGFFPGAVGGFGLGAFGGFGGLGFPGLGGGFGFPGAGLGTGFGVPGAGLGVPGVGAGFGFGGINPTLGVLSPGLLGPAILP
ncbi:hypothetical protein XA68_18385 [Ophiocordyceps unilateralis]|uniref:Uncharacterized protein n=1 Tax=Ophiocordyceps unilateralis TaxID=268505 RepID=A0A2A9PJG9_OPHUN|nr:hypothetical protein XA68_18385 [Ophiocordyceps unilateralis]